MKTHFHTFDAFRFLAFLLVFLFHVPTDSFPVFNLFRGGGAVGVIFFFVLSGFLITYKILEEKTQTGKLNLSHFFIRRILRIWPLYYAMVLFAFLTPHLLELLHLSSSSDGYEPNWWLTLTFLENYKMMATGTLPNVSPLSVMWTLCIEEHFYLVWGLAFYFLRISRTLPFLLGSIAVSVVANAVFTMQGIPTIEILTNIGYFAFGGLPAYALIRHKRSFENFINGSGRLYKSLFVVAGLGYVLLAANLDFKAEPYLAPVAYGIIFSGILCFTITQESFLKIGDGNLLNIWGRYTYGLYVYHVIFINLLLQLFARQNLDLANPLFAVGFVFGAFGLTLGVSYLSYRFFEKPFLQLKRYFY